MKSSGSTLFRGAVWNTISFVFAQGVRFVTNVALTRLLSPELFGTMILVNTLRIGMELVSDIGVGQNIIRSPNADKPVFYNTVFTMQAVRGLAISLIFAACAVPLSYFYAINKLQWIIPVAACVSLLGGITSLGPEFLKRELRFRELAFFEMLSAALASIILVVLCFIWPNIWSLVIGSVLGTTVNFALSYRIRSKVKYKFMFDTAVVAEVRNFSKWIFASSIIYFLSTNFDRLFFAKVVPLNVLGIYGIAKTLADLISTLAQRLGGNVLFPYLAAHMHLERSQLRAQFAPYRLRFLLLAALGLAIAVTGSDILIKSIYDRRYHDATWMLTILVLGSWFSILANVNEATLLGLGRPSNIAASNLVKLVYLIAGLPLAFALYGFYGAAIVISMSDLPRLLLLKVGESRENFRFALQDVGATALAIGLIVASELMRWKLGLGTSFDTLDFTRIWLPG